MSNLGRVLTLRVIITDPEKAKWIWDNHGGDKSNDVGVDVRAISEGDMFAEIRPLREAAEYFIREDGETLEESIEAHGDNSFNTVNEAINEAKANVSEGSGFKVVDRTGKVYAQGVVV